MTSARLHSPSLLLRALLTCGVAACSQGEARSSAPAATSTATTAANQTPAPSTVAAAPASTDPAATDPMLELADKGRTMGKESAGVWLLVVSDFQCPWCKLWHDETFPSIKRDYVETGKLRVAYINFPLGIHPNAWPSAMAAMCASAQGKFWEAHDRIFGAQKAWEKLPKAEAFLDSLAIAAGAEPTRLRQCTAKHETLSLIQADQARANKAGASTTPTFFIGGARIEGAEKFPLFKHVIDSVLAASAKAK